MFEWLELARPIYWYHALVLSGISFAAGYFCCHQLHRLHQ